MMKSVITPLSAISVFYIIHKAHMHAGAIWQFILYGRAYVREIIHELKLVVYLPVHTHKPYNNLQILHSTLLVIIRYLYTVVSILIHIIIIPIDKKSISLYTQT